MPIEVAHENLQLSQADRHGLAGGAYRGNLGLLGLDPQASLFDFSLGDIANGEGGEAAGGIGQLIAPS